MKTALFTVLFPLVNKSVHMLVPSKAGKNPLFLVQAVHPPSSLPHMEKRFRNKIEWNPQSMDSTVHITIPHMEKRFRNKIEWNPQSMDSTAILVHIQNDQNDQLVNHCTITLRKWNSNSYCSTTVGPALTCLYYPFPLPRLLVLISTRIPMCRILVSLLIKRWWLSLGESSPHLYCSTGERSANKYVVCQLQCTVHYSVQYGAALS